MVAADEQLDRDQRDEQREHGGDARDAADRRDLEHGWDHDERAEAARAEIVEHIGDTHFVVIGRKLVEFAEDIAHAVGFM